MIFLSGYVFSFEICEYIRDKTGSSDRLSFFLLYKVNNIYLSATSSAAAGAVRVARRLLASALTRSRQKHDGGKKGGEYSERLAAPTCSHRAAGQGRDPPNRLQTAANTRTRRAAADALRRDVIASRPLRWSRDGPRPFYFTFIGFLDQKLLLNISLKTIYALVRFVHDLKK